MPIQEFWSPPPIALVHHKVIVYHTYRYDNANDLLSDYWYTLDPYGDAYDGSHFDIRSYPMEGLNPQRGADHPAILRRLIDDPDWVDWWNVPKHRDNPAYRFDCPQCHADNPGFRIIQCTFSAGPDFTIFGARLTPDDLPTTVLVQCRACQTTFDSVALQQPDAAMEDTKGDAS